MVAIAIIGSGISGLGVASLLHPHHSITLYESSPHIGGHTRTKTIRYNDKDIAVDTGFIVFNHRNYPLLTALFRHLNVPTQKSCMTFGITIDDGAIEWGAQSPNALFGQRSNFLRPAFWRLLIDILRFNHQAVRIATKNPTFTLGDLLTSLRVGKWFAPYYLLPMGGAIWSCSLASMLEFPALTFVDFFKAHGLLTITDQPQWHAVSGGSHEYLKRLAAPFAQSIRTDCGVTSVTRKNNKVQITDNHGTMQEYDRVVFACHADQALALLHDATAQERAALSPFHYQKNLAVLHSDSSIMPKRKRCWSSWVYHAESRQQREVISITYWMNKLQAIDEHYPLYVTLNPLQPIAPEHVFDEHIFEHPIYSREMIAAQANVRALQGENNSWFCGAHLRNGFHEDGLSSAVDVAKQMGIEAPWR